MLLSTNSKGASSCMTFCVCLFRCFPYRIISIIFLLTVDRTFWFLVEVQKQEYKNDNMIRKSIKIICIFRKKLVLFPYLTLSIRTHKTDRAINSEVGRRGLNPGLRHTIVVFQMEPMIPCLVVNINDMSWWP